MYYYTFDASGRCTMRTSDIATANLNKSNTEIVVECITQYSVDTIYFNNGIKVIPKNDNNWLIFKPDTEEFIDPRTADQCLSYNRKKRNDLLTSSDWTQLPDVPIATKEAWAVYRQALRDITLQPDPFNIVWPTPP